MKGDFKLFDYREVCNLIYREKTKEACITALELLSNTEQGIGEALRYLYMRDAYKRLGEKEKVIKYGRLSRKYAEDYFQKEIILTNELLHNQCNILKNILLDIGKSDIIMEAFIKRQMNDVRIHLEKNNIIMTKNILADDLLQELERIVNGKMREEQYLYYTAAFKEIYCIIQENIPKDLYSEIVIHITRSA